MIDFLKVLFSFGTWLESLGVPREHVLAIVVGLSVACLLLISWRYNQKFKAIFDSLVKSQDRLISLHDSSNIQVDQAKILFKISLDADRRKIERFFYKNFSNKEVYKEFFYESWSETLDNLSSFKVDGKRLSDFWKSTREEFSKIRVELEVIEENDHDEKEKAYFMLKRKFSTFENHFSLWLKDGLNFDERKNE